MSQTNPSSVYQAYVPLRWNDFDRYGHLNNAQYIELAQEARVKFVLEEFPRHGVAAPVFFLRNLQVDFMKPILPAAENRVLVETTVADVGNTSLTTRQEVKDPEGRVAAVVTCVQVAVDTESSRPRSITAEERRLLAGYVDDGGRPAGQLEGTHRRAVESGRHEDRPGGGADGQ